MIEGYLVYWISFDNSQGAQASFFDKSKLSEALKFSEVLRKEGKEFVTVASQSNNSVGKPGVDSVEKGLLPNNEKYTWVKRRFIVKE